MNITLILVCAWPLVVLGIGWFAVNRIMLRNGNEEYRKGKP
jgi:hypothetical protein